MDLRAPSVLRAWLVVVLWASPPVRVSEAAAVRMGVSGRRHGEDCVAVLCGRVAVAVVVVAVLVLVPMHARLPALRPSPRWSLGMAAAPRGYRLM